MKLPPSILARIAVLLTAANSAHAANLFVTNSDFQDSGIDGNCSLVEAIENANDTGNGQPNPDCAAGTANPSVTDQIFLTGYFAPSSIDNDTDGANALPVITSTILLSGNNAFLSSGNLKTRFFHVAIGGELALVDLDLSGGSIVAAHGTPMHPDGYPAYGGSIFNRGTLHLVRVTVGGSTTYAGSTNQGCPAAGGDAAGGILYNDGGAVDIHNSTLSFAYVRAGTSPCDISGTARGGAVFSRHGNLSINNSTLRRNVLSGSVDSRGGGIFVEAINSLTYFSLGNSIVAESTDSHDDCTVSDTDGLLTGYSHHNLIENNNNCDGVLYSGDPGVAPLYHCIGGKCFNVLKANSPAIDAGDDVSCESSDIRGLLRPAGAHCDLGAFESTGFAQVDFTPLAARPGGPLCVGAEIVTTPGFMTQVYAGLYVDPAILEIDQCIANDEYLGSIGVDTVMSVNHPSPGENTTVVGPPLPGFFLPSGYMFTWMGHLAPDAPLGDYYGANNDTYGFNNGVDTVPSGVGTSPIIPITECTGDCDGSKTVTIGEVTKCVNLFLGQPLCNPAHFSASCPIADTNNNGVVSIGEVTQCVNHFLGGCDG